MVDSIRRWRLWLLAQKLQVVAGFHPPEVWFHYLSRTLPWAPNPR